MCLVIMINKKIRISWGSVLSRGILLWLEYQLYMIVYGLLISIANRNVNCIWRRGIWIVYTRVFCCMGRKMWWKLKDRLDMKKDRWIRLLCFWWTLVCIMRINRCSNRSSRSIRFRRIIRARSKSLTLYSFQIYWFRWLRVSLVSF